MAINNKNARVIAATIAEKLQSKVDSRAIAEIIASKSLDERSAEVIATQLAGKLEAKVDSATIGGVIAAKVAEQNALPPTDRSRKNSCRALSKNF